METGKLDLIEIGKIQGEFIVEDYQRGYRWGETEVKRLLEDIYSAIEKEKRTHCLQPICLQPIVVKKTADGKYELIDGQQRLTTVYLICKYMSKATKGSLVALDITIDYKTRQNSRQFLENIDPTHCDDYIDFKYMYNAYQTIEKWFNEKSNNVYNERSNIAFELNRAFLNNVKIIWYEVDGNEDSEKLFARLNIGRIPLTCAELVKAMFLSGAESENQKLSDQEQNKISKDEIAMQWDAIERELRDDSFWYFLTNKIDCEDSTRIELVLDLMARKDKNVKEKMHTFLEFDKRRNNGENLSEIWKDINRTFLLLKGWYRDNELYHRIGYLIAAKKSLLDIYNLMFDENKNQRTKTQFKVELDKNICDTINTNKDKSSDKNYEERNYGELVYTKSGDYEHISRLLLLFNIMTLNEYGDRFPFDKFKSAKWSLEHIHAQHSEGLSKVKEQQAWLTNHAQIIKMIDKDSTLVEEMENAAKDDNLTGARFSELHAEAVKILSPKGEGATKHNISNLALLNKNDNAALNNATFAVKRAKIIEMDRKDEYIPFCTKMVFLKYYSPNAADMYFWSEDDRNNYIAAINKLIYEKHKYLGEPIEINQEDEE